MVSPRKLIRRQQQADKRRSDMAGTGSYLFENNTKGEFHLPRPTVDGVRRVGVGRQFVGDSYFLGLVRSGELRLVKELNDPTSSDRWFVFVNQSQNDIRLASPSREGQTVVAPGGNFTGDSRHFQLLSAGAVRLIQEAVVEPRTEMTEKRLITEQPPTVTDRGPVEFVVAEPTLTEEEKSRKARLLTEDPLDGVKLLLD